MDSSQAANKCLVRQRPCMHLLKIITLDRKNHNTLYNELSLLNLFFYRLYDFCALLPSNCASQSLRPLSRNKKIIDIVVDNRNRDSVIVRHDPLLSPTSIVHLLPLGDYFVSSLVRYFCCPLYVSRSSVVVGRADHKNAHPYLFSRT